ALAMQRLALIEGTPQGPPLSHILSNSRYSVMLMATGGGYSRWGDIAPTRSQADTARDTSGTPIWQRYMQDGRLHSLAGSGAADRREVQFFEDRAAFSCGHGTLSTVMDVRVSAEDDAEVRRVSVNSTSRRPREVELASCAELVLATPAT